MVDLVIQKNLMIKKFIRIKINGRGGYIMKSGKHSDSTTPMLLYEQIKMGIKSYIYENELKVGDKIPTESELEEIFGASRITVRRSIKELVDENVIEVVRGKGTFVKAQKKKIHLLDLQGFTEGLSSDGNEIFKTIISNEIISEELQIPENLSDRYNDFLKLVRVVKDSEGPLSVDYAYLPTDIYPGIGYLITDNVSTFKLIKENYNVRFSRIEKEIEYVHPPLEVLECLEISEVSPVILVNKIIYDVNDIPVHYSRYYLSGDRIKFYVEAKYNE